MKFEWTIYSSRRMHPETWLFEWISEGWLFHPPGWPTAFTIKPNGEEVGKNHLESLTHILVNEAIDYPSMLPKALEALWKAHKNNPSQDLEGPADQLRTWIISTPTDPIFKGSV